ncbi:MAG: hypothetical protein NTW96_26655 [Planctomycetia bacterium]|nr:hypothetical protein [Planctomycetia bacterium]
MKHGPENHRPTAPGVIEAGPVYTLAEVQQRLQLGSHALREARRAGLKVRRIGRRGYVLGRDLIEFIANAAK